MVGQGRIGRMVVAGVLAMAVRGWAAGSETERVYLSGKGKDDMVQWDFKGSAGMKAGEWGKIGVPSNWELQGYGIYTYGNEKHREGWPKVTGEYKRTFMAAPEWKGKRVLLTFDGVMTDAAVKVNGKSAGEMHQGGYYRFSYDVTGLLNFGGENTLEVTVDDESANASVNGAERRADYWNYGGIFRPVYLEVVPEQYIERVGIDAKADGTMKVEVVTGGTTRAMEVEAQVLDMEGKPVGAKIVPVGGATELMGKIEGPRLWTAETPNLYTLEVRLKNGDQVLHTVKKRFGFRTIEVKKEGEEKGIFVNGKRVLLKGVCRHSFWPESGRTTSEALSREDVGLMKEANMNAVRMSHYPPDEHFLEACDEMGLYVLDELAGWHKHYDTEVGKKLVKEMVTRDVNHPSVLFWDNGNEGGFNLDLDDDFAKWDVQKREVLHPWAPFRGIDTKHYPNWGALMQRMEGSMVYFPTEMLHGLYDGGGGASLDDYWNAMMKSPVAGGGFIWVWADETLVRTDKGGILDSAGNQAPDGIVGPYREKEGSYWTAKEVWSPIQLAWDEKSGAFEVENRYSFLPASSCTFTWEEWKYKLPGEKGAGHEVVRSGKGALRAEVLPGAKGTLMLEGREVAGAKPADALAVRVKDGTGRELWTWVVKGKGEGAAGLVKAASSEKVAVEDAEKTLAVTAGTLKLEFDKKTGEMLVYRGRKMYQLYNGPRLVTGEGTLKGITATMEGAEAVVKAVYEGDLKEVTYRVRPNGWVTMGYAYNLTGPHDFFGIGFDYSENQVKSMRFLGKGPFREWKNREKGGIVDVYERGFNNIVTGDPTGMVAGQKFGYPEFKGYYGGVEWVELETSDGGITAVVETPGMYVQVLTPQFPPTRLQGKTGVNFPSTGLAFLNAIPAVGSKFVPASVTGPSAQQTVASGEYRGVVDLYFGVVGR